MDKPIQLAGGGNFDQQQQIIIPEVHVEVVQPPTDYTLVIVTGVVVPLIIAVIGWWLTQRKKARQE
jgi:hypothetical protein